MSEKVKRNKKNKAWMMEHVNDPYVQLAKKEGRDTVCALPSGISVPHMFVVVFVIMLPIAAASGDPIKGWEAGLTWVFVQSFVLMAGGFVAPYIKKITPRAALLGALAGVLGSMMALEAIREIVGFGESLVGRLVMIDARAMRFETLRYARDPSNPLNGDRPVIKDLSAHK